MHCPARWPARPSRRAGCDAFCLTVDTAVYSRRERDIARRYKKPWRATATGVEWQAALSWKDVERFKNKHSIPLILKGIATAEDARIAVEHGVEVVYVSNHGGRQLDHGRGTMEVVPEVMEAVGDRAVVFVDGGFMRGTDVVKALALGAAAVLIGRATLYGTAVAGEAGAARAIEIYRDEIDRILGLIGCPDVAQLDREYLALSKSS